MKQKTLSIIIFMTLVLTAFAIIPMNASAFSGTGSGTSADPYQITTIEQLDEIRDDLTAHYILMNNLDFNDDASYADSGANKAGFTTGDGWNPIGNAYGSRFQGNFNGDNHTISNLFIDRDSTTYVGLFGYLGGVVRNVGVTDADVRGQEYVGVLVGMLNTGTVYNCYSTGTVSGSSGKIGGLVGRNFKGLISKCYSKASVSGATIGGLVGRNEGQGSVQGTVENCYATGTVSASGGLHGSGGLIGLNFGTTRVSNCFATGSVSGGTDGYRGGLVGHESFSGNIVENSFYDEDTTGQSDTGKGEPKSTAEMKDINTFSAWNIAEGTIDLNNGYPYLGWQADDETYIWLICEAEEPSPQTVGGLFVPVDKTAILTPYIHMAVMFTAIIVLLAAVVFYYKRK